MAWQHPRAEKRDHLRPVQSGRGREVLSTPPPRAVFRELLTNSRDQRKELCPDSLNLDEVRAQAERKALLLALSSTKYNKTLTARVLGISRNKLYKKMRDFNLLSPSGKNEGSI
ncbi:MAG: helix-turn-helix domain-containing protein [Bilophila wadsworthia]